MHSIFRTVVSLILVFLTSSAFSQKLDKLYEKAELSFQTSDYQNALASYQEILTTDAQYLDVAYKAEICQLMVPGGAERSLEKFKAFESEYAEKDDHYYYWLGQFYVKQYLLPEAAKSFEKFKQKMDLVGGEEQGRSQELLAHTRELMYFFDNPDNYEIHQLEAPVNSSGAELSPVYFEDKNLLLFASDRGGADPEPFGIFYTRSGPNGWAAPKQINSLGSFSRKNANIEVVNEDGKLFLFKDEKGGDLFYSLSSGETWATPVEFDSRVSNNNIDAHFFINEHEDRIIFSSAQNGNGLDIYESFRDPSSGKWSKPSPFYSAINSTFDEDSPYLSPDEQTIYFSSNRPGGVGGLDIYKSVYDPATLSWSDPENMGWPINSPDDEYHFKMNANQTSGYFVSNRLHTKGDYDIYFFWEVQKVKVEGRIFDSASNGPLQNGEIRFHPSQYLDEYFRSTVDASGRYSTNVFSDEIFTVEIFKDGKLIHTEKFEVHETGGDLTTHVKNFSIK